MPRRTFHKALPGQVYAIEWPEWHVGCAQPGCEKSELVSPLGMCATIKAAEKAARDVLDEEGWERIKGLWYCQEHVP